MARTDDEASLTIEKVCETMKDRGGFTGKYGDLVEYVRQYLDEVAYQLCDGFSVNMRYFTIHPHIEGSFESLKEVYDSKKHPINFKVRVRKPLRDITRNVTVDIQGLAEKSAFIDEFTDTDEGFVNSQFIPGDLFNLTGSKIKLDGNDPGCGVFFVPVEEPRLAVRVDRIVVNNASLVAGMAPNTGHALNRIEVRTQYNGSAVFLKSPRVIASDFVLEAV